MPRWLVCLWALGLVAACSGEAPPPSAYAPAAARREPVRHADAPRPERILPHLPPRIVASVVSRNRTRLGLCHASVLSPTRVDVELEIAKEGSVADARVSGPSLDVASCVKRTVRTWTFPKSHYESVAHFPLVFQPSE